jgi:hypothetical protein
LFELQSRGRVAAATSRFATSPPREMMTIKTLHV